MKSNPVGWFEIYVQDMDRATSFYEGVLQVTFGELDVPPTAGGGSGTDMRMRAFPMSRDDYGAAGALVHMPGGPSGVGGTLVYFSCEDCAVEASRVVANGGSIVRDKFAIGDYGFIALATDSEGNMFGLHSMV